MGSESTLTWIQLPVQDTTTLRTGSGTSVSRADDWPEELISGRARLSRFEGAKHPWFDPGPLQISLYRMSATVRHWDQRGTPRARSSAMVAG